jgi:hypothetical protein
MSSCLSNTIRKNQKNGILYDKYKITYEVLNNEEEEWKPIPPEIINGTSKCFVSSIGRVRNTKGRETKGYLHTNNYMKTSLNNITYSIHRLVAMIFIPNPENKSQVNHIDGNRTNNNIKNLEWSTANENCFHRDNVLPNNKLRQVLQFNLNMIKIREFTSLAHAGRELKLHRSSIGDCCRGIKQKTLGGFIFRYSENTEMLTK